MSCTQGALSRQQPCRAAQTRRQIRFHCIRSWKAGAGCCRNESALRCPRMGKEPSCYLLIPADTISCTSHYRSDCHDFVGEAAYPSAALVDPFSVITDLSTSHRKVGRGACLQNTENTCLRISGSGEIAGICPDVIPQIRRDARKRTSTQGR